MNVTPPPAMHLSRGLFIWSLFIAVLLIAMGGFVLALPRIAPQFVITHSPWI